MEEKVKSIPITVADVLGYLVPGLIWLLLIVTAFAAYDLKGTGTSAIAPPTQKIPLLMAWERLDQFAAGNSSVLVVTAIVLGALLIGYVLKPVATTLTTYLIWPFVCLFYDSGLGVLILYGKTVKFPFDLTNRGKHYHTLTKKKMEVLLGCQAVELDGSNLFHSCRRYLWINAPVLSEIADRREAEVRMFATLYLGALLSLVLSLATLVMWWSADGVNLPQAWAWLGGSLLAAALLAHGFFRMRTAEVSAVYHSTLVTMACKEAAAGLATQTAIAAAQPLAQSRPPERVVPLRPLNPTPASKLKSDPRNPGRRGR